MYFNLINRAIEGIDYKDNSSRLLILVGVPFPDTTNSEMKNVEKYL